MLGTGRETVRIHQRTKLILALSQTPVNPSKMKRDLEGGINPQRPKRTQEITTRLEEKKKEKQTNESRSRCS